MDWVRAWRVDVARPEVPTARRELPGLILISVGVVALAQLTDPGSLAELAGLVAAIAAYGLRGLVPRLPSEVFAVLVVAPVTAAVVPSSHLEAALFLNVTMVLYASWHLGSTTRAVLVGAAAAGVPWLAATASSAGGEISWAVWALACAFTLVMGRMLQRQGRLIAELDEARTALADQAVAEERRRIARELHDIAGHTLAAVLLHVTGARHVLRRDVDEAERALVDAETVGRASLDQIRATVAALRTDERGTDPALAGSADLEPVVDEYRRAGLTVAVHIDAPALDGPVGIALHRIVRESLANVARHAPGNTVDLTIDEADTEVRLVVADHGTPGRPAGQGHFGVVGMAERARALGGDLVAGATDDGWRVEAHLPLPVPRDGAVRS